MSIVLMHRPPLANAGRTLLWAVAGFGMAIIVFGLSTSFWLSLAALFATGAFDCISVIVRHTLVQLQTPDHMHVSAISGMFISQSNELGEFESGTVARARLANLRRCQRRHRHARRCGSHRLGVPELRRYGKLGGQELPTRGGRLEPRATLGAAPVPE